MASGSAVLTVSSRLRGLIVTLGHASAGGRGLGPTRSAAVRELDSWAPGPLSWVRFVSVLQREPRSLGGSPGVRHRLLLSR